MSICYCDALALLTVMLYVEREGVGLGAIHAIWGLLRILNLAWSVNGIPCRAELSQHYVPVHISSSLG